MNRAQFGIVEFVATHVHKNDQDLGPFGDEELLSRLREGSVLYDDFGWREGMDDWRPLKEFFSPGEAPPPLPRPLTYVCPKCGSDNIQNARLLYESGTSTSRSSGQVIGAAGLGTGDVTLIGGGTISSKKHQTLLAARHGPPKLQEDQDGFPIFCFLCSAGALIGAFAAFAQNSHLFGVILLLTVGGLLAVAVKLTNSKNARQQKLNADFRGRLAKWEESFLCLKCGYFGDLR